ncbi:MAG: aspartate--ammonia ligase [Sphaerochaetaceae bacterium]|nr:aspartate--ammonia ligase [Sphaerochaetaceae bacterium]
MSIVVPKGYKPLIDKRMTEKAIKFVKDTFERELSSELKLSRVTSTLFVPTGSGINDDLSGVERPVRFEVGNLNNKKLEIVHSLAKWKRMVLADQNFRKGTGLYTDMDAIRPDDLMDNIHSIYVDQWDWELVMGEDQRDEDFLMFIVSKIYEAIKRTEFLVSEAYPKCKPSLPENITFIDSQDLLDMYPDLNPVEREKAAAKKFGAVFVMRIGAKLSDGVEHGLRAPDYDDWSLNGDIIVWDTVRKDSLELSSMGIRVDRDTLVKQLKVSGKEERLNLYWHKRLMAGEFPQTIGGGIGQSRLCMFLLKKAHIGEVQASVWSDEDIKTAEENGIPLL